MKSSLISCYGAVYALLSLRASSFTLLQNGSKGLSLSLLTFRNTPRYFHRSTCLTMGKPKSGAIVDSYQTVSVNCKKCQTKLFRYKKKNGTKSNLVKCYIERISEDCQGLVEQRQLLEKGEEVSNTSSSDWNCPKCQSNFGRDSMIHGRPAIKLIGGKIQMTKK